MSTTLATKKGSSLAKFLEAAAEQEWEIAHENMGFGGVKVIATAPIEKDVITRIEATFEQESGRYWSAEVRAGRAAIGGESLRENRVHGDHKIGVLLNMLAQGPKRRRETATRQAEIAAEREARRIEARVKLDLAAETEEIQSLQKGLADRIERVESDLRSALKTVVGMAEKAMKELDDGHWVGGSSAVFYNSVVPEVEKLAGQQRMLLEQKRQMEFLFGELPLTTEQAYRKSIEDAKAEAAEA